MFLSGVCGFATLFRRDCERDVPDWQHNEARSQFVTLKRKTALLRSSVIRHRGRANKTLLAGKRDLFTSWCRSWDGYYRWTPIPLAFPRPDARAGRRWSMRNRDRTARGQLATSRAIACSKPALRKFRIVFTRILCVCEYYRLWVLCGIPSCRNKLKLCECRLLRPM